MHLRIVHAQENQNSSQQNSFQQTLGSDFAAAKQQIMKQNPYVILGVIAAIIITITIIICCIYRRYITRKLYAETPQNFSYRPELVWIERRRFQKSQIDSLTSPDGQIVTVKEDYQGKYHQIRFTKKQCCVYYHHRLVDNCYFEIEFVKLNANVQIGFVHKDDIETNLCKRAGAEQKAEQLKKKNFFSRKQIAQKKKQQEEEEGHQHAKYTINFDQYGVSVKTDGSVVSYGVNLNTYKWSLQYGDVIGLGMTLHDGSRRVWVTRNGVMMNPPTEQEMLQELKVEEGEQVQAVSKKAKVQEDPEQKQRAQKAAAKNRIELKTTKKFSYYATIACLANEQNEEIVNDDEETIINLNVGAHKFRLFDGNKMKGLLNK